MSQNLLLTNARVVTAMEVFLGTVQVTDGVIRAVDTGVTSAAGATDLEGDYLLPGLVELHTDNLEKHFTPRPGVRWPSLPAVVAHDAQVVAAGITTVFDAWRTWTTWPPPSPSPRRNTPPAPSTSCTCAASWATRT
jgi:alpha-D-ribose 1-methylphosphonate 5-triphosphate diphosphatase